MPLIVGFYFKWLRSFNVAKGSKLVDGAAKAILNQILMTPFMGLLFSFYFPFAMTVRLPFPARGCMPLAAAIAHARGRPRSHAPQATPPKPRPRSHARQRHGAALRSHDARATQGKLVVVSKEAFLARYKTTVFFWLTADTINLTAVPAELQLLFGSFAASLWGVVNS